MVLTITHQVGDRDDRATELHSLSLSSGTKMSHLLLLWPFLNLLKSLVSAFTIRFVGIQLMLMLFATRMQDHETT